MTVRNIQACLQLLEEVRSSELLPTPSPTEPLLPWVVLASDPLGHAHSTRPLPPREVPPAAARIPCPSCTAPTPTVCSFPHFLSCSQLSAARLDIRPCLPSFLSRTRSLALFIYWSSWGDHSLRQSLHCSQKKSLFPQGDFYYFTSPAAAPSIIHYRALQSIVPDPLSQDLGSRPEVLRASYVISNKLPRRVCCRCKFKNHGIHPRGGNSSVNPSRAIALPLPLQRSPMLPMGSTEGGHSGQGLSEARPLPVSEDSGISESEEVPKQDHKNCDAFSRCTLNEHT